MGLSGRKPFPGTAGENNEIIPCELPEKPHELIEMLKEEIRGKKSVKKNSWKNENPMKDIGAGMHWVQPIKMMWTMNPAWFACLKQYSLKKRSQV